MVVPNSLCKRDSSMRMFTRNAASRLERGSSNKKTLGFRTMARPIATRWRCPPDNSLGNRSSNSLMRSTSAMRPTWFCRSCFDTPAMRSENPMFSATVMCG